MTEILNPCSLQFDSYLFIHPRPRCRRVYRWMSQPRPCHCIPTLLSPPPFFCSVDGEEGAVRGMGGLDTAIRWWSLSEATMEEGDMDGC